MFGEKATIDVLHRPTFGRLSYNVLDVVSGDRRRASDGGELYSIQMRMITLWLLITASMTACRIPGGPGPTEPSPEGTGGSAGAGGMLGKPTVACGGASSGGRAIH
jgi:hypothetical protein